VESSLAGQRAGFFLPGDPESISQCEMENGTSATLTDAIVEMCIIIAKPCAVAHKRLSPLPLVIS
jgi:hypothetical protein